MLTHLHLDHIDGLYHFPNQPVLVNAYEWERPYGELPKLFPDNFSPQTVVLDESLESFSRSKQIAPNLWMVQTAGHTYGHSSFLLKTDEGYLLFAGDVVYVQEQLEQDQYAGGTVSFKAAKASYNEIRAFAKAHPTLLLPSHDQGAAERLKGLQFLNV